MRSPLWIALFLGTLIFETAYAHNVVGGVYAIGKTIEGEAGFSNGDMAKVGTKVQIADSAGQPLGATVTDEEGLFIFEATQRIDHHFHLDLRSGHVLDMVLPADELPVTLPGGAVVDAEPVKPIASGNMAGVDAAVLQQMIEQVVAKQIKPLRKELAAYKEKASLQDLLGGIGYIFGLVGIGVWLRQRKQDKTRATVS